VPRHLRHLSAALRDHHQITVVSEPDRGGYGFCAEMGLRHHALPGLRSALDPRQGLRAARALRDLIAEDKPDLVWAHARMALPVARWALRGGGPRLAVTYHGLPFGPGHGVLRSALSRAVEALTLPLVVPQDLIFLTEEDRAAFPARLLRRHRAHVLPNTSDLGGMPVAGPHGAAAAGDADARRPAKEPGAGGGAAAASAGGRTAPLGRGHRRARPARPADGAGGGGGRAAAPAAA
jgi:hypothetical protein